MSFNLEYDADKNELMISFTHARIINARDEMHTKEYFRELLQKKHSAQIPLDEIEVMPKAGERIEVDTTFIVRLGEPLYAGLRRISSESPESIRGLAEYLRGNDLDNGRAAILANYAVKELEALLK